MKRYQVFKFDTYYPMGGMNDWNSEHDTIEEAKSVIVPEYLLNWQIWDIVENKEVCTE